MLTKIHVPWFPLRRCISNYARAPSFQCAYPVLPVLHRKAATTYPFLHRKAAATPDDEPQFIIDRTGGSYIQVGGFEEESSEEAMTTPDPNASVEKQLHSEVAAKATPLVESLQVNLRRIVAAVSTPTSDMFDLVKVTLDNNESTVLAQVALASLSPDGSKMTVEVFDPEHIRSVQHSLNAQEYNAAIMSEATLEFTLPPITSEKREATAREAAKAAETCRISLRKLRQRFLKKNEQLHKNQELGLLEKRACDRAVEKVLKDMQARVDLLNDRAKAIALDV